MEHWQIVIVIYCGIAFVWSLYTLFRYHKFCSAQNGSGFVAKWFWVGFKV